MEMDGMGTGKTMLLHKWDKSTSMILSLKKVYLLLNAFEMV